MTSDHLLAIQTGQPTADAVCRAVVARVWDYLDGNCAAEVAARVDAHLGSCPPCLRLRELQDRFFASVARLRERWRAPARVHRRVRAALEADRWASSRE